MEETCWRRFPHFQNKALGHFPYPQPGAVGNGPVIYDFEAHEYTAGLNLFLFDVRETLDANLSGFMALSGYVVDMEKEEVCVGVSRLEDDGSQAGGLLLTDFEGTMLFFAPLNFTPEHIVLHPN